MSEDYEHKTLELRVLVNPGDDHPLIVETRDKTHSADLKYALENGILMGEPANMALTRDQNTWLKSATFKQLQQQHYGKVYGPPKPGTAKPTFENSQDVRAKGHYQSQVTDLMEGWKAAVVSGETTASYDEWTSARVITGYLLTPEMYEALKGMIPEGSLEGVKPVWEDRNGTG